MMRGGVCFVVMAFLFAELFGILVCAGWMTCDVTLWTQNDVKYGISVQILSLQALNFAGLMCCKNYTF